MTEQTLAKKIRLKVNEILDKHGILDGTIAVEIAAEVSEIARKHKDERPKPEPAPREWTTALYKLCRLNVAVVDGSVRKYVSETCKALIADGAELDDLGVFENYWYSRHSFGRKGQAPRIKDVRNLWQEYVVEPKRKKQNDNVLTPEQAEAMFDPRV